MPSVDLPSELDVLRDVSRRLSEAGISFRVTGSMATNFYAVPRMTRHIDLVLALGAADAELRRAPRSETGAGIPA